jgi:hypothetical protein
MSMPIIRAGPARTVEKDSTFCLRPSKTSIGAYHPEFNFVIVASFRGSPDRKLHFFLILWINESIEGLDIPFETSSLQPHQ